VLFKFLDNAIKKTEKDDIMVTCRPGVSARNEPRVIFEVTNSGRPIDRQDRPLLFRLRFRPGSQHGSKSTGIGLYQAWLIAQKLGGDVGYTTDEVSRNTFWLSLPAAEVPADR
jgi:signal transduction histidine kinase